MTLFTVGLTALHSLGAQKPDHEVLMDKAAHANLEGVR